MKSGWLSFVASIPILAIFGGAGVMAYFIGDAWAPRHTDLTIVAASLSCLGIVAVVTAGVTIFMVAAYRIRQVSHETSTGPPMINVTPSRPPSWAEQPPMLTDKNVGSWETTGQGYDLWEDEQSQTTSADQGREG